MDEDSDSDIEWYPYNPEASVSPFNYQDPLSTSNLSQAILDENIELVKAFIRAKKNLNKIDNNGNNPLHLAVMSNRIEILNLLLSTGIIDFNRKNYLGFTPLLLSVSLCRSDSFIKRLLETECNINLPNNMNETVLHYAVRNLWSNIIPELIERGANLNAQDDNKYTPLHQAVQSLNHKAVCTLLYYGADVFTFCIHHLTPFMYAVNSNSLEICETLFDYYDDFSDLTNDGYNALLLATNSRNRIAINLVKSGADVNCISPEGYTPLYFSLFYETPELFIEIWHRINYRKLLKNDISIFYKFLKECSFSSHDWLQCIYLMIYSDIAKDLLGINRYSPPLHARSQLLFVILFHSFFKRKINVNDRLTIMYIILSFGYEVNICDLREINQLYGFNEELEGVIYFCGFTYDINIFYKFYYTIFANNCFVYYPLITFILCLEESDSIDFVIKLFKNQLKDYNKYKNSIIQKNTIFKVFNYFSFSVEKKHELLQQNINRELSERIKAAYEFPSLVEISRNTIRRNVTRMYKIRRSYEFHTIIKQMSIPQTIKDIITFKKPIYHY